MKIKIAEELTEEFINECHKYETCEGCKYKVNVGHNSCSNAFFYDRGIDELLNNVSESIIWDILAEIMKRNIGASDGADKVIDYLQKVAEQLKASGKNE